MIRIELTEDEARILLDLITRLNWAGENLATTEKHVAIGIALREKFARAFNSKGTEAPMGETR